MKSFNVTTSVVLGVLIGLFLAGCQSDAVVSVQAGSMAPNERVAAVGEPNVGLVGPIALPRGVEPIPVVTSTALITPQAGGRISAALKYISASNGQTVTVRATLVVLAGGVNGQKVITMTLDTSVVGVQFAPKGLRFDGTSFLYLEAENLDPAPSVAQTGFYYFGEGGIVEPRTWSSMQTTPTSIRMEGGTVPHFSRYAFGR